MYEELVKRLREADEKSMCGECGLNLHTGATKKGVLFAEAADAIEQLQKDLERSKEYEAFWEEEATEALKKFQVAVAIKPRWISVAEQLPKPGKYLVLKTSELAGKPYYYWQIVSYADNLNKVDKYDFPGKEYKRPGWFNYDSEYGHYETGDKITHWMPLPEPPKEETE